MGGFGRWEMTQKDYTFPQLGNYNSRGRFKIVGPYAGLRSGSNPEELMLKTIAMKMIAMKTITMKMIR